MSDQIKKFLDEEWKHESWEYVNDVPRCACGEELRDDEYPGRALDEHRVRAALAAAGGAPQPEADDVWEYKEVGRGGEYVTYRRPKWSAPVGAWEPAPTQEGEQP